LSSLPYHDAPAGQLARQRLATRLSALPPRALFELLAELERQHGAGVFERATVYAEIDIAVLRATGGDRFPAPPLHAVEAE
jgi:hypothetical protein